MASHQQYNKTTLNKMMLLEDLQYFCPHTRMMITALFIMTKNKKKLKCPSTGEWIDKLCYIHTKKYYIANKKNYCYRQKYGWISQLCCIKEVTKEYVMIPFICSQEQVKASMVIEYRIMVFSEEGGVIAWKGAWGTLLACQKCPISCLKEHPG